jgi:hypothetical protein
MALSDVKVRNAKARDKAYKLADSEGLSTCHPQRIKILAF